MSEQVEDIMDFIEPEEYLKMNELKEACDCNEGFGPSVDCRRCGGTGTVLTPEDKLRENFEKQHSYQVGATWVVWDGDKYVKYCKHLNSLAEDWATRLNNELAIFRAGAECQQAEIHELEEVITQNEEYIQGHIKGKAGQQAENKKLRSLVKECIETMYSVRKYKLRFVELEFAIEKYERALKDGE